MELVNTAVTWVSWALAAYMVGVTLFLAANIAIGAIKTRSALWWYLVYSVVVVGMMLAGLKYLPSMVLQYSNEGIEAAQPEMARFAENVRGVFNTAAGGASPTGGGSVPPTPTMTPPAISGPTDGSDPDAGGGAGIEPTMLPIMTTPTLAPTGTPNYEATANARLATVTAAAGDYQPPATPGPTATYDILHPPTPVVR